MVFKHGDLYVSARFGTVSSFTQDQKILGRQPSQSIGLALQFPDMNPIETLWAIMKRRLSIKDITSKQDLVNSILNICS